MLLLSNATFETCNYHLRNYSLVFLTQLYKFCITYFCIYINLTTVLFEYHVYYEIIIVIIFME